MLEVGSSTNSSYVVAPQTKNPRKKDPLQQVINRVEVVKQKAMEKAVTEIMDKNPEDRTLSEKAILAAYRCDRVLDDLNSLKDSSVVYTA